MLWERKYLSFQEIRVTRVMDNDHTCIPTGDMLRKVKDSHRLEGQDSTLGAKDAPFVPKALVYS